MPVIVSGLTSSKIFNPKTYWANPKFAGHDFRDSNRLVTGQLVWGRLREQLQPGKTGPIFLDELGIEDGGITAQEFAAMGAFELTGPYQDCAVAKALRRIQDRPTVGGAAGTTGGSGYAGGGGGRKRSRPGWSRSGSGSVTPEPSASSIPPRVPGKGSSN